MIVRRYHPSDATALVALFHASVRHVGILHYSPEQVTAWSPSPAEPDHFNRWTDGRSVLVAVDANDVPLGYGDLEPNGHLDHLYCRPDKVRTGVGAAIYAALEVIAIRTAVNVLTVEASEGARRFFLQCGFSVDDRNDFVLNGVSIHNYRMTKRLHESLRREPRSAPVSRPAAYVLRPAD